MESTAARLARGGWTLRTGLSPGADQAFYRGARAARGVVELYLPWPGFESDVLLAGDEHDKDVRLLTQPSVDAYELAAQFDRRWAQRSACERRLLARDCHQVLGEDLATPTNLVICWTADGDLDGTGPRAGGTGQALRIAHDREVPVVNLARDDHAGRVPG